MEFANKHWTDAQKEYVIDVWGEIPIKRIAKNIGKSYDAVKRFAERNGLGGVFYNDHYLTTTLASQIIGVDPTTIQSWIKTKQLKARKQTMGIRKIYLIDPHDYRNFLRDNQDKWNATKLQDGFFDVEVDWLIKKKDADSNLVTLKKGTSWTTKEERRLLELVAEGKTTKEIAIILDRTPKSVQRKRERMRKENKYE